MAAALVPLQNITLGSAQSSVTFASIPTTGYRDLRVVLMLRDNSQNVPYNQAYMRVNADTGSNYPFVEMTGDGSSAGSYSNTFTNIGLQWSAPANSSAGTFSTVSVDFLDSNATDKHKSYLLRNDLAGQTTRAAAGRWASTSAITSLLIYPYTGNFAAGSTFALYGVVA